MKHQGGSEVTSMFSAVTCMFSAVACMFSAVFAITLQGSLMFGNYTTVIQDYNYLSKEVL